MTRVPHRTLHLLTLFSLIAGCSPCRATSVVILLSHSAIVVGADGKTTGTNGSGQAEKLAILQGRMAIAGFGVESITDDHGNLMFDFPDFTRELDSQIKPDTSLVECVAIVRNHLTAKFENFDDFLKTGKVTHGQIPFTGPLITLYVVGYENREPRVYSVELDINWFALSHTVPEPTVMYPTDGRKNLDIVFGGEVRPIYELMTDSTGPSHTCMAAALPQEINALLHGQDLPTDRVKRLARGLLELEVQKAPETVGFPLTILTISRDGGKIVEEHWNNPSISIHCAP